MEVFGGRAILLADWIDTSEAPYEGPRTIPAGRIFSGNYLKIIYGVDLSTGNAPVIHRFSTG
jgi:hypothetical protein